MSTGTIYVDCTNTVFTGFNTGIQRVVRNIVMRLSSNTKITSKKLVPVVAAMGHFYRFDADISKQLVWTTALSKLLVTCRNLLNIIFMNKYSEGNWPVDIVNAKFNNDTHSLIVNFCRKLIPIMYQITYRVDGIIVGNKICFNDDDVLFLSDAFWKENVINAISNISNIRIRIILLVYDLFPITHPEVFDTVNRSNYVKCLHELIDNVIGIVSISKASLADIESYVSNIKYGIVFNYFHLGADFSAKGRIIGDVRHELRSLFASGSTYLAVGTIEPRKNYHYLLNAFDVLWENDNDIKLCIVGRIGWICEDLLQRIRFSKEIGKRLFYFTNLNDDELKYCYHSSRGVVYPSIIEGFGLPLVEAMHYGKPIFASDIPVFREIANEYPIYCNLEDHNNLALLIHDFESGLLPKQFEPQQWLSWDESIEDLLTKVVAIAENRS